MKLKKYFSIHNASQKFKDSNSLDSGSVTQFFLARKVQIFLGVLVCQFAFGTSNNANDTTTSSAKLTELCQQDLKGFPGKKDEKLVQSSCSKVKVMESCTSVDGVPLYHYEKAGNAKNSANVLVLSLIHGDETPAGSVARYWMERLESIDPRNNWRVIPVLNPDGFKRKTRTNAHKVDVNRNFPTKDWDEKAKVYWKRESASNPRRYPGDTSASEPETKCVMKHIEDFKPEFIVSIHTPLKVLDFDGPNFKPPKFDYLPWKSLGHYPGSLGRYMWFERQVPVLTMELKEDLPKSNQPWGQLQDIIGVLVGLEAESKKPASYGKN